MIIGGNSAGATLATAACYLLKTKYGLSPRSQILIYPCLDTATPPQNKGEIKGAVPTARAEMYNSCYRKEEEAADPLCSPAFFSDDELKIMPDTLLLTAEYDTLREEGESYAQRLMKAGIEVTGKRVCDAAHGFFMKDTPKTAESHAYIAAYIRNKLLFT